MNERGDFPERPSAKRMSERQLYGVVIAAGIIALVFGFFQILNAIRSPFQAPKLENTTQLGATGSTIAALSKKDTDSDGLTDFDELYQYQTSPYLADSDSDGESDQAEVFGSTDPNCPQGETCTPLAVVTNTNSSTNTVVGNENINISSAPGSLSVDELRIALRDAGAPAAELNSMSDEQLLQLYQDIALESGTTAPTITNRTNQSSSTNAVGNTNLPSSLENQTTVDRSTLEGLSPEQIREFLRRGGVDESTMNQVDDDTLRAIFQQALNNSNIE